MELANRNDKKYWNLHNHNLFKQLNDEEVAELCIVSRYKEGKKGDIFEFVGEAENKIFILKQGVVKIIKADFEGNEVVKDVLQRHDLFGQLPSSFSTTNDESREYAMVASDFASICVFTKEAFERVLAQRPNVSLKFAAHVGDKIRKMEQRYNSLIFKDTKHRLIDFLVKYVKEFSTHQANSAPNYLTQGDIAQLIGASRQTVVTLLTELEKVGFIAYSRKEIKIMDSNYPSVA